MGPSLGQRIEDGGLRKKKGCFGLVLLSSAMWSLCSVSTLYSVVTSEGDLWVIRIVAANADDFSAIGFDCGGHVVPAVELFQRSCRGKREREREGGRECRSERAGNRLIALRAMIAEKGESPSGLNSVGGCMGVSVV